QLGRDVKRMHVRIEMCWLKAHEPRTLDLRTDLRLDFVEFGVRGELFGIGIEIAVRPNETWNEGARRDRSPPIGGPLGRQSQVKAEVATRMRLCVRRDLGNHGQGAITVAEVMNLLSSAERLAISSECETARSSAFRMRSFASLGYPSRTCNGGVSEPGSTPDWEKHVRAAENKMHTTRMDSSFMIIPPPKVELVAYLL